MFCWHLCPLLDSTTAGAERCYLGGARRRLEPTPSRIPDQESRVVGAMMTRAHGAHTVDARCTTLRIGDEVSSLDDLRDVQSVVRTGGSEVRDCLSAKLGVVRPRIVASGPRTFSLARRIQHPQTARYDL